MGGIAAELVQQTGCGKAAVVKTGQVATAGGQEYTGIAIGILDPFELAGQGVQGLVPGNPFESCPRPLHPTLLRDTSAVPGWWTYCRKARQRRQVLAVDPGSRYRRLRSG